MDEISNGPVGSGGTSGSPWRRYGGAAALVAGGLVAGGVLASTLTATAANPSPSPSTQSPSGQAPSGQPPSGQAPSGMPRGDGDQSKSQRSDEQLLTGTTASKVRAAALAKYPGATIQRVETDSDGVYEAHLVTSAGQWVTVEVGKDFTVTGTEAGHGGYGRHGYGGHDGYGGKRSAPNGTSPESSTPSGGAGWSDGGGSNGGGQAA